MNFKTTVILIVLLAGAGVWLYFSQAPAKPDASTTTSDGAKLVDIDSKDITKIVVTPSDGPEFAIEKQNANWQITKPITAPADTFEVDSMLRAITDAKSRGEIDPTGANAAATGLAKPRYQVQVVTPSKTINLAVGEKSAVGDTLYVQIQGKNDAQLIPTDLSDRLDKGAEPYRRKNLVSAASDQIKQVTITRPEGNLVFQKTGASWQLIQPERMPVDEAAASSILFAITGLRTESFADPSSVPAGALARPQLTVAFSTDAPVAPPTTAPTSQPTWTTIQFGAPTDILHKNIYVTVAGSGVVGQVASTELDNFKKKPFELRDKKAIDLDPEQVSRISLQTDIPSTTQPTTRPASNTTVTVERRKVNPVLGPTFTPTTQVGDATTNPAAPLAAAATAPTTAATTAPAPLSKWIVTTDSGASADDAKVSKVLTLFHPLTADKYLESAPVTLPAGTYTLTITTTQAGGAGGTENKITILDPGHEESLLVTYNGVVFQAPRTLLSDLEGPWIKKP